MQLQLHFFLHSCIFPLIMPSAEASRLSPSCVLKDRVTTGLGGMDGGRDAQLTLPLYKELTGSGAPDSCNRKEKGREHLIL